MVKTKRNSLRYFGRNVIQKDDAHEDVKSSPTLNKPVYRTRIMRDKVTTITNIAEGIYIEQTIKYDRP